VILRKHSHSKIQRVRFEMIVCEGKGNNIFKSRSKAITKVMHKYQDQ
jgi:hypothetical protein